MNNILFFIFIFTLSISVSARVTDLDYFEKSPYISDIEKIHKDGILLISQDKYSEAWQLLLPSAKKGNANSMFILGKMIISTPSLSYQMEAAQKLLTQAAKQNHPLASHALKELEARKTVDQISKLQIPPLDIDPETRKAYEEAMRRFDQSKPKTTWIVEYIVFMDSFNPEYNDLFVQMDNLKSRLKK